MGLDGRRGHTGQWVEREGKVLFRHSRHSKAHVWLEHFAMDRTGEEASTSATGGINPAVNPLGAILAAINSSQRETRELRAELRAAQEEATEEAKKLERPHRFMKKAHEEQAFFNDSIADHIEDADLQLSHVARLLAEGPVRTTLEKAKLSLKGGKDALAHRQKLIRVADRSELGWAVVAVYEANSLAVDSDDKEARERAERTAERKVTAKRKKSEEVEKARKVAREVQERPKAGARWNRAGVQWAAKPVLARPLGPVVCYGCGEADHFKRECPKKPSEGYPFGFLTWCCACNNMLG